MNERTAQNSQTVWVEARHRSAIVGLTIVQGAGELNKLIEGATVD